MIIGKKKIWKECRNINALICKGMQMKQVMTIAYNLQ